MLKYGLFVCAFAGAAPVQAEDWWLVSQARDFAGFIDVDSISTSLLNGERLATMRRIEYRLGPNGEKSHIVRASWDCDRNLMTIISSKTYDAQGNEIGHFRAAYPEQEPQRVSRGSIGRAELDFVCEKPSKTSRVARRAETDMQDASDKAFRLRRLGFTFTDAFALTLTNPNSNSYSEMFEEIVPAAKRDDTMRILGFEKPSPKDMHVGKQE